MNSLINPIIENVKQVLKEAPDMIDTTVLPLANGSGLVRLGLVLAIDYSTNAGDYVETSYEATNQLAELYTDSSRQNLIIIENPEKYHGEINNISKKEMKALKKIYADFIQADPKEYVMIELDLNEELYKIGYLHKIKYLGTNGRIESQEFIHTHGEPFVPEIYINKSNDMALATKYIHVTDRGIENTTTPYF